VHKKDICPSGHAEHRPDTPEEQFFCIFYFSLKIEYRRNSRTYVV
jgi:hypothetical protein